MLKSVGTDYVLAGHSERRAVFGDSDEDTNKKVLKILGEGLKCILCIGELKEERETGETFNVCDVQLTKGLKVPRHCASTRALQPPSTLRLPRALASSDVSLVRPMDRRA